MFALAAGLLTPLAFAPFDIIPLAFVCPAALFILWRNANPKAAFWNGYGFGLGMFGAGVSWVFVSMHDFGGVSVPVAVVLTSLFVAFLALFPATVGWTYRRFFSAFKQGYAIVLVLPALWVLFEWCRGWIFTGFPWLALGYSQVDSPLSGLAPLLGVYGVSWSVVVVSAVVAQLLARNLRIARFALPALVILFVFALMLRDVEWSTPQGAPIQVTLLQGNMSQDQKWRPEMRQPTIDWYVAKTRENWTSDLIVWPETALPVFYHQAQNLLADLRHEALDTNTDLFIGVPVMNMQTKHYFNSMVSIGRKEQIYTKQHLVPFGEYIPLAGVLGGLMEIMQVPLPDFSVEPSRPIVELAGTSMGVSICYEDAFGEEVIESLPDATVLINVSNDAWFGRSAAPHQHMQMARMRAIETRRPMLRATNTGVTAVVDHRGHVIARAPQFEAAVLNASVQPMRGLTIYAHVGNWPIVSGLSILVITVFLKIRTARRTAP